MELEKKAGNVKKVVLEGESSTTAASTEKVTSVSSTSVTTGPSVCVKIEAMKSEATVVEDISTTPELAVSVSDFTPGQSGVSFPGTAVNPNITIVFNRPGNLFVVKVPEESETNVQQIAVSFFDENDNLIVAYTSPPDSPVLPNTLDVNNVWKIVIEIMSTFDDESPKNVTFSVVGCFSEGKLSSLSFRILNNQRIFLHFSYPIAVNNGSNRHYISLRFKSVATVVNMFS